MATRGYRLKRKLLKLAVAPVLGRKRAWGWLEADGVVSINVLDHCYDLAPILSNVATYLKPGGLGFLSFDSHQDRDLLHPLTLGGGAVEAASPAAGLLVEKQTVGLGPLGPMYGQGRALNYWLRKPTSAID